MDEELEAFKTTINLSEYAASWGFRIDRKTSSRHSVAMRHDNGDKIIIKRNVNGHWIYTSPLGSSGEGSIVDFVQSWKRCKLGGVRQTLRPWIGQGGSVQRPPIETFAREVIPSTKDRLAVLAAFETMQPVIRHPYLETARGLPAAVLGSPRFAGKIYMDGHRNAVFPHRDRDGVCGYELKNKGFTGFAPGGEKGLWFSACRKTDTALVIVESGINAPSYAILHPDTDARYASIGGKMNPGQPALIRAAIARMAEGSTIIAATDNDPGGHELAEQIEAIVRATDRTDLVFKAHWPDEEGSDWNDCLRSRPDLSASGPLFAP